mmetsp:Transcript_2917/g.4232  ORF Transcript_2917/g.4232 Transcript_2917/m.4232 type:complete len:190 (-) Transcript_2917:19-588(-)
MMQSTWRMILQRRESISLKGKRSLFNFALFVDVHIIDSSIIVSTLYYRNSFKEELSNALDQALPDAGAIRLEARARYIGRVVDAIDAALSKHDHIFIPASTRLGRVRATVPTCVACDRPLTSKCRKLHWLDKDLYQIFYKLQHARPIKVATRLFGTTYVLNNRYQDTYLNTNVVLLFYNLDCILYLLCH